jgi:hypothetical protein
MKRINPIVIALALLGVTVLAGLGYSARPAGAAPPVTEDRLLRDQVKALQDIATELREMRRECGR